MSAKSLALACLAGIAGAVNQAQVKVNHVAERQAIVDQINSDPTSTWRAEIQPRFHGEPIGASKSLCGVQGDWAADTRALIESGEIEEFVPKNPDAPIPESFDSATAFPQCAKIINDIRDQSNCGCCWAFAGAEAASDRMCIATKGQMMEPISAQDICFCSNPNGCDGGQIDTPWRWVKERGAVSGGQYQGSGPFGKGMCADFSLPHCHHHGPQGKDPYPAEGQPGCLSQRSAACPRECDAASDKKFASDKYKFSGMVQSASGEQRIQQMIMEGGPVETAFTVYSDFENYAGGVYQHKTGSMAGGHAVKFVGWGVDNGVKYWKVANSWNPYWGENGYFRIIRGDSRGNGGIENQVTGSPADAKWTHA